jgi:antirestriction protein ArdC
LLPDDECEFLTYNQFKTLQEKDSSIKIKKGCHKYPVIFWKFMGKDDKDKPDLIDEKNEKPSFITRYYSVFKLADIEGLETKFEKIEFEPIGKCEEVINNLPLLDLRHGGDSAYYSPTNHHVQMPKKESFISSEHYYSTLFHEVTHWTGHKSMLNRHTECTSFGSSSYSKEELIAEMGASMLLGFCGVGTEEIRDNQLAYLRSWLKKLKDDKRFILSAAQSAQKACDIVVNASELQEAI